MGGINCCFAAQGWHGPVPRSVLWYARVRAERRPRRVFVGVGPAARPLSTAGAPVEERGVVVCRPSVSGCRGYTPCMCWAWCWPMAWCCWLDFVSRRVSPGVEGGEWHRVGRCPQYMLQGGRSPSRDAALVAMLVVDRAVYLLAS